MTRRNNSLIMTRIRKETSLRNKINSYCFILSIQDWLVTRILEHVPQK